MAELAVTVPLGVRYKVDSGSRGIVAFVGFVVFIGPGSLHGDEPTARAAVW